MGFAFVFVFVFLILCGLSYVMRIFGGGKLSFWKLCCKYPDKAFLHFMLNPCWFVYQDRLPPNYRDDVPESEWAGPFHLLVPMLGNTHIRVFGKEPEYLASQDQFVHECRK